MRYILTLLILILIFFDAYSQEKLVIKPGGQGSPDGYIELVEFIDNTTPSLSFYKLAGSNAFDGDIDLSRFHDTIDVFDFTNNILSVSLYRDNQANKTVDLSSISFWDRDAGDGVLSPKTITDKLFLNEAVSFTDNPILAAKSADSFTSSSMYNLISLQVDTFTSATINGQFGIALGENLDGSGLKIYAHQEALGNAASLGFKLHLPDTDGLTSERFGITSAGIARFNSYIGSFEDVTDITTENIALLDATGILRKTAGLDALVSDDTGNGISIGADGRLFATLMGTGDGNDFVNSASFNTSTGDLTLAGSGGAGDIVNLDNRYLITEVDGSTTNEIQDLSLSGNTLSLSSDPSTVDLSPYLDNTDNQDLDVVDETNGVNLTLSGDATPISIIRGNGVLDIEGEGDSVVLTSQLFHGANINYLYTDGTVSNVSSEIEYPLPVILAAVTPSPIYHDWTVSEVLIWVDGDVGATCDLDLIDENDVVLGNLGGTNGVGSGKNVRNSLAPGFSSFNIDSDTVVRLRASNVSGQINNIHVTMRMVTNF